jgi:hypothetical protein
MVALNRPAAFVSSTGYISVATDGQASSARTRAELLDYDWEVDTARKVIAAVGPSTVVLACAIPGIEGKKLTTTKVPAEPALHSQDTRSARALREDTRGAPASGWRG